MQKLVLLFAFLLPVMFVKAQTGMHPNIILTQQGVKAIKEGLGKFSLLDKTFSETKNSVDAAILKGVEVPVPKDPGGGYTHEKHKTNYLDMLNAGIVWQVTGDKKYAEYLKAMLLAYAKMYPTLGVHPQGVHSGSPGVMFWQSLNDAVWLVHVAQSYDCVYDYLTGDQRNTIETNLLRKAVKYMMENDAKTFNRIHNHGTWSVAGVAMAGYAMGDKDIVEKALYGIKKDKKSGFLAQISELYSPDGYYAEGAYYERYAIMPFILLAKAVDNNNPSEKIFAFKDSVLAKTTPTLLQMTDTHGQFIPFNDALKEKDWLSGELVYAVDITYGSLQNDRSLLYVATKQDRVMLSSDGVKVAADIAAGKVPASFNWKSVAFSDGANGAKGGVCFMRYGPSNDLMTTMLKYSTYGMDHGHFDKLTMSYYDQDKEIFTDYGAARFINIEQKQGGRYLSETKSWAKQTIAHNTVTVDGKSNYNGNVKLADDKYSFLHFNDISNSRCQVVSAKDTTAYAGVAMQRTLVMVRPDDNYVKPVIIDVFRLTSPQKHQYDYNFYYNGSLIETNSRYKAAEKLEPFGKNQGYQHLFVRAKGAADSVNTLFTIFNEKRFYTILTATQPGEEIYLTETGATDPNFNLRHEPGITIRSKDQENHVFASVIEAHGSFNSVTEASVGSTCSFDKVEVVISNEEATVILLNAKSGKKWILMLANGEASDTAKHKIVAGSQQFEWMGNYKFTSYDPEKFIIAQPNIKKKKSGKNN